MAGERELKRALDLADDRIEEIGVFPAPTTDLGGMSGELTTLVGLGRDVEVARRVGAALPIGQAFRLNADPRILILEDIPDPSAMSGPVTRLDDHRWIVDSRGDEPAALLVEADGHRIGLWGAHGEIRLYELRSAA